MPDTTLLWLDAHLSPETAAWLRRTFDVDARPVRDLELRAAEDLVIFMAARAAGAALITKDSDFVLLQRRLGPPPQIVWLTCGNTSNANLSRLLTTAWPRVAELLAAGEPLIEVGAVGTVV